jgi:pyridoxine kinase
MKSVISIQSHVVFGHLGNSSTVFPMRRMGVDVWPINTVQYSNNSQYGQGWTGKAIPASEIVNLVKGLDNIHQLENCSALISGDLKSVEECDAVAQVVQCLKQRNSQALYVCEPVISDPLKKSDLAEGVRETITQQLLPVADIIVLSQTTLTQLTGVEIATTEDAVVACRAAMELGPKIILVQSLPSLHKNHFSMMLATPKRCYLSRSPKIKFERNPPGVGDLITGVFTAAIIKGMALGVAFKHVHNAVYGVLKVTEDEHSCELESIAGQCEFSDPSYDFPIKQVGTI